MGSDLTRTEFFAAEVGGDFSAEGLSTSPDPGQPLPCSSPRET